MLAWLMVSLLTGSPSGLGADRIEQLVRGLGGDASMLQLGIERRVQDLARTSRTELADEALHLLAPLAERVGLPGARAALEEHSFRILDPDGYGALAAALPSPEADAATLAAIEQALSASLGELGGELSSRRKSLWSTAEKMRRKGVGVDAIHDRLALRLVVDDEAGCYRALDRLLERFGSLPGELDDYIASPRPSGYQALHAALRVPVDGRLVTAEIQVRSRAMHEAAEHGAAAHWRYKLG